MSLEAQNQKMLSIIYQIPVGLVETDPEGNVQEMNAMAIQFLMPQFIDKGLAGENLFDLLKHIFPKAIAALEGYERSSGNILDKNRFTVYLNHNDHSEEQHLILTLNRLSAGQYLFIFDDITELQKKEQELFEIQREQAVERGKFDVISGVLHDIGNAVVGFGSYLTKVKQLTRNNDATMLGKLAQFIKTNKEAIGEAIGAPKAGALVQLAEGLKAKQEDQTAEMEKTITDQMNIVSHVKDILNIQRQYLKPDSSERSLVSLRGIINDALAMQLATLEKRNVEVRTYLPDGLSPIKGDHTKLMQVFLNLIKNSIESMDQQGGDRHQLTLQLKKEESSITATIQDTGIGFDKDQKQKMFKRGFTTKARGSGLGLNGSRSILSTHDAVIDLDSPGIGKGATVTIKYPLPTHT
jgi:signal transduction histidine kinase